MPNQPAELFFPSYSISLSASVVDAKQDGSVVLASPGLTFSAIRTGELIGSSVWMSILDGRDAYRIPCIVEGYQEPLVLVSPTSAPERIPPRSKHRYDCHLPVVFRERRQGRSSGVWQEGTAVDINMAGTRLEIESAAGMTEKIEMKIALPACFNEDALSRVVSSDSEMQNVVSISARVKHWGELDNGRVQAGVHFEFLTPNAELRLGSYLEHLSRIHS